MAGFDNDVVYGSNVDFSGGTPVTGKITTNGQLLVGSTVAPNIQVGNLISPDASITIGYISPHITLKAASTGAVTNVLTANATPQFTGTTTKPLDFSLSNLVLGSTSAGILASTGLVGIGYQVLQATTSGVSNTALGYQCLKNNTDGTQNSAGGYQALLTNVSGNSSTAFGYTALAAATGGGNCAFGCDSARSLVGGSSNCSFGFLSLLDNTTGDSNCSFGTASMGHNTGYQNCAFGANTLEGAG